MLLAIDAGNTNTVFALCEGEKIVGQWRIATDAHRTADEYAVWLFKLMELAGLAPKAVTRALLASVVPAAVFELKQLAKRYFAIDLHVVGEPGLNLGITAKIDRPEQAGADRLVNALAAHKRFGGPLVVVDFGTATTFDVVNAGGDYVGGVIAPGVNLSLEALQRAAARLPNVAIAAPEKVVGTNTVSAMQSGIYYGYLGLIEGIVARIQAEYSLGRARVGADTLDADSAGSEQASPPPNLPPAGRGISERALKIIATGGLAPLYARSTRVIQHVEPDLTILGLCDIAAMN